jgi:hypothetical protein
MYAMRVVAALRNCQGRDIHHPDPVFGNVRLESIEAGIRDPQLTLRTISGLGGIKGFLLVFGWTLALIGGVLLAVFS